MKTYALLFCVFTILGTAFPSMSHELHHETTHGDATVVELLYSHHEPFSNQSYELFRPGENVPFQTGRTDVLGRIVFVPDREGAWRIRAFSQDGHGIDLSIYVESPGEPMQMESASLKPHEKIFIGIAILFGFFGIVSLIYGGRRVKQAHPL